MKFTILVDVELQDGDFTLDEAQDALGECIRMINDAKSDKPYAGCIKMEAEDMPLVML